MGKCLSTNNIKTQKHGSGIVIPLRKAKAKKSNFRQHYQVDEKLSEKSRTSILLVTDKVTKDKRAVKSIRISRCNLNTFMYEVEILQMLDHPNIIKIYDVYLEADFLHIVTEYCEGGELFERISSRMHFSEHLAALYMRQIASSLIYLHKNKVIHRDLKPENIVFSTIEEDSPLKLINFSKISEEDKSFLFKAPECYSNKMTISSNIWSLGIIFYLMLCGKLPFSDKVSEDEHFFITQNLELEFKEKEWKSISEEAKDLILHMIVFDPTKRYSAVDIFESEWLKKFIRKSKDQRLSKNSIRNLSEYAKKSKFKKALLSLIMQKVTISTDMQALLDIFLEVDSEGQGVLAPHQILECVQKSGIPIQDPLHIVTSMNINKTGLVTYTEFLSSLVDWTTELNEAKLTKVFKEIDTNGDGVISPEEFMDILQTNYTYEQVKNMIAEADTNGDGMIDFQEFCAFLHI